jgi:hypothetical protein
MKGYVYILEVRDILLPVCKIGMTTRTPQERLTEINQGATGDFLWDVSHALYVNDCLAFEKIIHQKLAPLRQKRREFFNLSPDDAYKAVTSILDRTTNITLLQLPEPFDDPLTQPAKRQSKRSFGAKDAHFAHWLDAFNSYFTVPGKPFGQTNKPFFGMSDGVIGVQWNMIVNTEEETVELGVNLEGSEKMGGMLITDFLLARPNIATLKQACSSIDNITIKLFRDAWQVSSRPAIKEQFIGDKVFSLDELTDQQWQLMLGDALTDNYREQNKAKSFVVKPAKGRFAETYYL